MSTRTDKLAAALEQSRRYDTLLKGLGEKELTDLVAHILTLLPREAQAVSGIKAAFTEQHQCASDQDCG